MEHESGVTHRAPETPRGQRGDKRRGEGGAGKGSAEGRGKGTEDGKADSSGGAEETDRPSQLRKVRAAPDTPSPSPQTLAIALVAIPLWLPQS